MNKQRLQTLAGLLSELKKSLNENKIIVKGKQIQEPKSYVVKCHTKPSQSMIDAGLGKNVRVGDYVVVDKFGNISGTRELQKATFFKKDGEESFDWGKDTMEKSLEYFKNFSDVDGTTGDFYFPVPAEEKTTRTIKLL